MCGRARCTIAVENIPRACYRTTDIVQNIDTDRYRPSYNISPGHFFPILRPGESNSDNDYVVHSMVWGLVPSFCKPTDKPDFFKMFNARSESVGEKPSFRRLLPKHRCLVVAEGFYEWKKDGSKKQPFYIHFKDGRPLVFAGLYDSWKDPNGEMLYTFTILTTSASSNLQWLHDRMPVILGDKEATDKWLDCSASSKYNLVLKPYEQIGLVWYPVTPKMGSTSFDGPECIKQIQLKTTDEKSTISKFFTRDETKDHNKAAPETRKVEECVLPDVKKEEQLSFDESCASVASEVEETIDLFKRNLEEEDTEESKPLTPPAKKATLAKNEDKQPTLVSYFGRK